MDEAFQHIDCSVTIPRQHRQHSRGKVADGLQLLSGIYEWKLINYVLIDEA